MPPRRQAAPAAEPIGATEFAALMAPLGPFGRPPVVSAALSGGADSLALCLLADAWARAFGGRAVALTVDHGLRPGAREEARRCGVWLSRRGIAHYVFRWRGDKPLHGIQAAAREARYRLLCGWCERHGVLHLLLAHHREDQAETFLMRLARGSGVEGLAAMAPLSEDRGILLVRPFLNTPKARLVATLRAVGQPWIEDPSNRDPKFERIRFRHERGAIGSLGMTTPRLAQTARHLARARAALDAAVTDLLAHSVSVHAAGFCVLDAGPFAAAANEVSLRALSRIVMCIAGAVYPPRFERLARLHGAIVAGLGSARTLSGCRIAPYRGRILICREAAAAAGPLSLAPGARRWDGRFTVTLSLPRGQAAPRDLAVARLGVVGWRQVSRAHPESRDCAMPVALRTVLLALWDSGEVVSVPHLDFRRAPTRFRLRFAARFEPPRPLSPVAFSVV